MRQSSPATRDCEEIVDVDFLCHEVMGTCLNRLSFAPNTPVSDNGLGAGVHTYVYTVSLATWYLGTLGYTSVESMLTLNGRAWAGTGGTMSRG
jgi:hypothetical protein